MYVMYKNNICIKKYFGKYSFNPINGWFLISYVKKKPMNQELLTSLKYILVNGFSI